MNINDYLSLLTIIVCMRVWVEFAQKEKHFHQITMNGLEIRHEALTNKVKRRSNE